MGWARTQRLVRGGGFLNPEWPRKLLAELAESASNSEKLKRTGDKQREGDDPCGAARCPAMRRARGAMATRIDFGNLAGKAAESEVDRVRAHFPSSFSMPPRCDGRPPHWQVRWGQVAGGPYDQEVVRAPLPPQSGSRRGRCRQATASPPCRRRSRRGGRPRRRTSPGRRSTTSSGSRWCRSRTGWSCRRRRWSCRSSR